MGDDCEIEVKVLKRKKGVPTVIKYEGRRYILDHQIKGANKQ